MRKYFEIAGIFAILLLLYFGLSYFGYNPPLRKVEPYSRVVVYSVGYVDEIKKHGFVFADSTKTSANFVECDVKDSVDEDDIVLVKIENTPENELFKKITFVKILNKSNRKRKVIHITPSAETPK